MLSVSFSGLSSNWLLLTTSHGCTLGWRKGRRCYYGAVRHAGLPLWAAALMSVGCGCVCVRGHLQPRVGPHRSGKLHRLRGTLTFPGEFAVFTQSATVSALRRRFHIPPNGTCAAGDQRCFLSGSHTLSRTAVRSVWVIAFPAQCFFFLLLLLSQRHICGCNAFSHASETQRTQKKRDRFDIYNPTPTAHFPPCPSSLSPLASSLCAEALTRCMVQ